jgi:hypothetical protein
MVRTKIRSCILLALLTGLIPCFASTAATAAASASGSGAQVIADCQAHQRLTHPYTVAQLKNALATLPADVDEYTNCEQVIEAALTHAGGKGANNGAGTSSSGSSFLPTPVIVILVLLILAAVTFGAISVRRRGGSQGPDRPA